MSPRVAAAAALALLGACALSATPARALTAGGVAFPDTYPTAGQTLRLNGAGVRVFFALVNGYASALYVETPAHDAAALLAEPGPKVVVTEFLHAADVGQLKREFANVHDHYCARNPCPPGNEASYREMVGHLAPVTRGETATYVITGKGVDVLRNHEPAFSIDNPAYGPSFLAALIGATSPAPGYRAGLLGKRG